VVLGLDPEDRDGGHAVITGHLFGELQCGDRLQQRVDRTPKQTRLLPGQYGNGPRVGEPLGGSQRLNGRASTLLLCADRLRHVLPPSRVRLRPGDRRGPGRRIGRISREKRREPGEV
jgi:hypothetical protein